MDQQTIDSTINVENCKVTFAFSNKDFLKIFIQVCKKKNIKYQKEVIEDGIIKLEIFFASLPEIFSYSKEFAYAILKLQANETSKK